MAMDDTIRLIQRAEDKRFLVFRHNDNFMQKWDLLIMVLALFNCFFVPLQVAFQDPSLEKTYFTVINSIIDFVFSIDILICFRTVFIDDWRRML